MPYANSSSSVYGSCSPCGYQGSSKLEKIVYNAAPKTFYDFGNTTYMIAANQSALQRIIYEDKSTTNTYSKPYHAKQKSKTIVYRPVVDIFLAPDRPLTSFIGHAEQIKEFIKQAFYYTTGKQFPEDIIVHVLPGKEFEKMHKNPSIRGFAINRKPFGFSEVFVRQDCLDMVMVTLGHEIGHVLTETLNSKRDEEAKAFAFCVAWLRAIKQHNIANLSTCIRLGRPANNNIHDKALDFVLELINQGLEPLEIFQDLSENLIRVD